MTRFLPLILLPGALLLLLCHSGMAQNTKAVSIVKSTPVVKNIPVVNGDFSQPLGTGRSGWFVPSPAQMPGYTACKDGSSALLMGTPKPGTPGAFGTITQGMDAAPYRGQRIRLRAEVRALPSALDGAAFLWLRVDRAGGRQGFFDNMADRPIAEDTWQTYEIDGEVAPDARHIVFGMGLMGSGQARVRHVTLTALGPINLAQANTRPLASLQGPGVIHITMQAPVRPIGAETTGTVTIPMPGALRDQVPLDFHIVSTPANALRGVKFMRRPDGQNWVCVATVTPPPKGALLRWQSDVLVWERPVMALPKEALPNAARPDAPPEAMPWTRATACVQSGDPAIVAKAQQLAQNCLDTETYARRVVAFTSTNRGTGAKFDGLDASKGLVCGGSCTDRANLAAALLRARGIAARTISHMPAWSAGQPLYEHWLAEYWHPGAGWVRIEPTLGQMQPSPTDIAVLSVSTPEDEDKAFDPVHLRFVMPGAAYLSVCELSPELTAADLLNTDAINTARAAARIGGTPAQMVQLKAVALRAFARWTAAGGAGDAARGQAILAAARTGKASALTAVLGSKKGKRRSADKRYELLLPILWQNWTPAMAVSAGWHSAVFRCQSTADAAGA